jgi:hypothetical protein
MFDLMSEDIILVEKLELPRKAFPDLDAVYFVTPKEENVDKIIADFAPGKPKVQYGNVHLFFTSRLADNLLQRLGSSGVGPRIRSLREVNLEFLAPEPQLFHFDSPNALHSLYLSDRSDYELRAVATKLSTVCAALQERPTIRFRASSRLATSLAALLDERLKALPAVASASRGTLIIVDRLTDLRAPLLHEFTYQAMVYDLLDVKNDVYSYVYTNNANQELERKVLVGDHADLLWPDLRHRHIAETIKYVLANFNDFQRTNKAAGLQSKSKDVTSLKEMGEAMKAMPQYQEMLNKYSLHIHMASECMKMFKHKALERVGMAEQDLAMGRKASGDKVKNPIAHILPLLSEPQISADDKLRLVMLAIVSYRKGVLPPADREQLMLKAGFQPGSKHYQACDAIAKMFVTRQDMSLETEAEKKDREKKEKQRAKEGQEQSQYVLSRFVPQVKTIVEEFIAGTLPADRWPALGGDGKAVQPKREEISLKTKPSGTDAKGKKEEKVLMGSRIIVFVLGGLTHSELRSAYELTSSAQREVIIGSSGVLTPKLFVDALSGK